MAMLRVNLLPDTYRKSQLSPIEQFHRTPLFWIILVLAFILPLAVPLPVIQLRLAAVNRLSATIHTLAPKRLEVERIRKEVESLRKKEQALESIQQQFWSKRLNILSDLTPAGVWFTDLMLEPSRGLTIQGSAVGEGAEVMSVGRLVQDLKVDPDFTAAIKDVQIESIKRVQERETEVVQFTLTAVSKGHSGPVRQGGGTTP